MKRKKILVVIPYLAKGAQGNELEFAVSGWRMHFMCEHEILIVGDWHPVAETDDDIHFLECPQISPVAGQYLPHLDIVNKFIKAKDMISEFGGGFIYTCDDIYAVKDFTLQDVLLPKISDNEIRDFDWRREGGWLSDLGKTRELCLMYDLPVMNWVCHLPVAYMYQELESLFDRFDGRNNSYVWENIYFNYRFENGRSNPVLVPPTGSIWKYEISTSSPCIRTTDDAHSIWITNANCGWSPKLEEILRTHYGL